jgi:hypothetical protein
MGLVMTMKLVCVAFACTVVLGACATITRGTTEKVQFLSEPSGARMTTSIGLSCNTPCTLDIQRKESFQAKFELPGYQTETVPVTTIVQGAGAVGVVGNAVIGGVIGVGVDVISGAANDHSPNPVSVTMRRINAPGPALRR